MIFTGKNADKFDAWLQTKPEFRSLIQITTNHQPMPSHWKRQPIEIITGVALAYADSLGIKILIDYGNNILWHYVILINDYGEGHGGFNSRPEAYKEAFKKFDELRNEQLK